MRILLFPGMGATKAMYSRLYSRNGFVLGCDWPDITKEESFSDLAMTCIAKFNITHNDIVAGSSMGGMVAAEIHKVAHCRKLIMIGSALTPMAVPFHRFSDFGAACVNERLLNFSAASVPFSARVKSSLLSKPGFVKWSLRAFRRWCGVYGLDTNSISSVHGLLDPVIPVFRVKPTLVIHTGGHLIAITHANTVASFIGDHAN